MSRIAIAATAADAPEASQPLLAAAAKQLGSLPNLFRAVAVSPQALEGFLGLSGALGGEPCAPQPVNASRLRSPR